MLDELYDLGFREYFYRSGPSLFYGKDTRGLGRLSTFFVNFNYNCRGSVRTTGHVGLVVFSFKRCRLLFSARNVITTTIG